MLKNINEPAQSLATAVNTVLNAAKKKRLATGSKFDHFHPRDVITWQDLLDLEALATVNALITAYLKDNGHSPASAKPVPSKKVNTNKNK